MSLNSVSEDIVKIINTATGFGIAGTDLFAFEWGTKLDGAEVNKQTMITDLASIDAPISEEHENPVFLILVRGDTKEARKTVHDRARALYQFILQENRQTINGILYLPFAPVGGLVPLGTDDNNRVIYSMTFFTYRQSLGDST